MKNDPPQNAYFVFYRKSPLAQVFCAKGERKRGRGRKRRDTFGKLSIRPCNRSRSGGATCKSQVESLPCAHFVETPAFITRVSLEPRKCLSPGATRRGQESSCALLRHAAIATAIAAAPSFPRRLQKPARVLLPRCASFIDEKERGIISQGATHEFSRNTRLSRDRFIGKVMTVFL